MSKILDGDQIVQSFKGGIHCSQTVMMQWADEMEYEAEVTCTALLRHCLVIK